MSRSFRCSAIASVVLQLSLPTVAGAQDEGSSADELDLFALEAELKAEVTAASRYKQSVRDIAAPTFVITDEQIRNRGYRDLKDIFLDLPGFDVSANVQGEVRTLVTLRGISGNQKLLLLQDGQRLNPITGERFVYGNNVPLHMVKRIEVITGPAAAMYGPDAYAGVVNIVTKDGSEINGFEVTASAGFLDQLDPKSWATDNSVLLGGKIGSDAEAMLSLRYYHTPYGPDLSDDFEELRPIQFYGEGPNAFTHAEPVNDWDLYGKLRWGRFTFGARYSDASETNAPSTIPDNYLYVSDYIWRQQLGHAFASYQHTFDRVETTTSVRYQLYRVDPSSNFFTTQDFVLHETETSYTGEPIKLPVSAFAEYKYARTDSFRAEELVIWNAADNLIVSGGALVERVLSFPKTKNLRGEPFDPADGAVDMSEFRDPVTGKVLGVTDETAWGLRPYTNLGASAQVEYLPLDSLRLTLGARADHNSLYGATINPRLGMVWRPNDDAVVRAMFGSAYIQPSNYYVWENWANPFAMHIPNLELRPERIYTANLGGSYQLSSRIDLAVDLFYNRMVDIIRPVPYGQPVFNPFQHPDVTSPFVEINANQGVQYTYGGELKLRYVMPQLSAYASYAYLDGLDLNSGMPISKMSHHKVLLGAEWSPGAGVMLSPRLRWTSGITMEPTNPLYQERLRAAGGNIDEVDYTFSPPLGFWLVDLNARKDLGGGLSAYATIHNLLNAQYYGAAPYAESLWILPRAPQLRLNAMIGLTYQR
jgi:outer membrane receptor protein involved in Fe transport